jgi:hypothetical protein
MQHFKTERLYNNFFKLEVTYTATCCLYEYIFMHICVANKSVLHTLYNNICSNYYTNIETTHIF